MFRLHAPHNALLRQSRGPPVVTRPVLRPCQGLLSSLLGGIAGKPARLQLQSSAPELTAWLQAQGVDTAALKVVPQDTPGQGRGLVAAADIAAGERVLELPQRLVLFPATAAADSVLAPLLAAEQDTRVRREDWPPLLLFLAEQRYYLKHGFPAARDKWAPFARSLPQGPLGTVLDWPAAEVKTLLVSTGLQQHAATILTAAEAVWQELQPLLAAGRARGLCPADMFSRDDFDWAVSICLSRSVRLDASEPPAVVLVPYADMANHSTAASVFLEWDCARSAVVLAADRSYKAGEQVFISYGCKSSGVLLLSYGFAPPPGSNAYDAAYIMLGLDERADPLAQAKRDALAARGMPAANTFGLLIDALPEGLLQYAAFCAVWPAPSSAPAGVNEQQQQQQLGPEQVQQLAAQLFHGTGGELPLIGGVSSELLALQQVLQQVRAALRAYPPAAAAADKQAAAAAAIADGGTFAERAALMASVRVRERQILSRTECVAAQRVKELKRSTQQQARRR